MNQSFWTLQGTASLYDGVVAYDNSCTTDPKRPHQLVADGSQEELLPNKKQALEVSDNIDNANNNIVYPGMLNSNVPLSGTALGFHSYPPQFAERSYDSEAAKNVVFDDRNFSPIGTDEMSLGSKVNGIPFGNVSSFNLSTPFTLENPRSSFCFGGGFKKVRVSEVKDSENLMSGSISHTYSRENGNTYPTDTSYNGVNNNHTSVGLSYSKAEESIVPIGNTYENTDNNVISTVQSFSKVEEIVSTGQTYKNSMLADNDIVHLDHSYKPVECNVSAGLFYNKAPETSISRSCAFSRSDGSILSMGHSYNKAESTIISFGGYDDDYDEMLAGLTPTLKKEATNEREFVNSNVDTLVYAPHVAVSATKNLSKKKDDNKISKKVPSNNFPPNVRSLLSTGILDGVPVKYIAWSREKQLPGVIKGSGYLCGCQSCHYSEVINAYEFERHAGCKTKHPNNHIYFENGKTIYGAVQELKSTPQNLLLDAIQTIAGSPINQESFRLWKVSFLAATRELKRIYGNEEVKQSF